MKWTLLFVFLGCMSRPAFAQSKGRRPSRDKVQISLLIMKVLHEKNGKAIRGDVIDEASVSTQQFSRYMGRLIDHGFVSKTPNDFDSSYYGLTDKGERIFKGARELFTLLPVSIDEN